MELKGVKIDFLWIPSHIQLTGNDKADAAAKPLDYSVHELFSLIFHAITGQWQQRWMTTNNGKTLHAIKTQNKNRPTTDNNYSQILDIKAILAINHCSESNNCYRPTNAEYPDYHNKRNDDKRRHITHKPWKELVCILNPNHTF
ncbi:hypothetical protein CHS0354_001452 [Potamilus streckersoni]|uniref:RNase H type-1 domain-containing protein n=1 Tax=Potamilus streckersoni TaxID=2493646 RepID=A0AAE0T8Z9_9BIVA|nr:hypothetical protein CHS0354_001452 [Potamilus streckersoni]